MTRRSTLPSLALAALAVVAFAAPFFGSAMAAGLDFHKLTLVNNWAQYPGTRLPSVAIDPDGIVHMKGGLMLMTGSSDKPFVLAAMFRPVKTVYVLVDMLGASSGRLTISPNGTVSVQSATDFSKAAGFTSLEGVTYATQ